MIIVPLNLRGIIGVSIFLIILMISYIKLSSKDKIDYEQKSGKITYIENHFENLPIRDIGKYRYIEIQSYSYPFEIFIGNESGDFKPKFEQIDNLKLGDSITIYFYETHNTHLENINRFAQFIDKGNVSYFEKGDSSEKIGLFVIVASIILSIGAIVMWKMKKLDF